MDTVAGYKTKHPELLYAFIPTIFQNQKQLVLQSTSRKTLALICPMAVSHV